MPDGRLAKDGLGKLLETTGCKAWLYSEDQDKVQAELELDKTGVKLQQFPSLEWCLDVEGIPHYPYTKTYEEAKYDDICIIHTSGTTGPPKPIFMNHGFWSVGGALPLLARRHWPRQVSTDIFSGRSVIMACQFRWNSGLILTNTYGVFCGTVNVLPPADVFGMPPEVFEKVLRFNQVDGLIATPFNVVELFNESRTRESLKALEFVTYLGAALDRAVGDALCEHTRLGSVIGATDSGGRFSLEPRDRKLWYTYEFIPEAYVRPVLVEDSGLEGESDVYQMVIDRPLGGGPSITQCAFWNTRMFGSDVEYVDTKELWKPVKDIDSSTRWEFVARTDDWVKLIWLAKFNAHEIEDRVIKYPGLKHVIVGGTGRAAPYMIIEAKDALLESGKTSEDLLDEIYQKMILDVNKADAKAISIPRETVLLAKKEKPFKVSLKQVVLRREVEKDYQEEIEDAYKRLENADGGAAKTRYLENMK